MNFNAELVEKAKEKLKLKTDAELLQLLTKITKQNLSNAKTGKRPLSEEQALEIAEKSGLDPEWVLVSLAAYNTKSEAVKTVWSNLAKKLLSHGLALVLLITSGISSVPETGKLVFLRRSRYIA